ncbi:peptidylprolyl isomerase [Saccharophagus sp. K07]|uniref:peptidylprolyl isomerase n=1 Tax=Saccharophagus sp. K07 TaxID=2283636 RepID=UPI001652A513|nr:peptidylprolyl isomerase [Saccharophagus sp. K07]MBC6906880.1 peptidylprolyl isomerase [Saccharophagus sp. K07]
MRFKFLKISLISGLLALAHTAQATIVLFETNVGNFEVNLFDMHTPATVENFLNYVEDGSYDNTFIHRLAKDFVIQGGGFAYDPDLAIPDKIRLTPHIEKNKSVVNEPVLSNRRGTIAMAKVANNPNSATSEWFFNLTNNSANLDYQNGGFTVFGQVSEEGLEILDEINKLSIVSPGGAFTHMPVLNYTAEDYRNNVPITDEHRVMIHRITVVDDDPHTAADLKPVFAVKQSSGKKKKGGAPGGELLLIALACAATRRLIAK